MFVVHILATSVFTVFTPNLHAWLFIDSGISSHSKNVCSQKHMTDAKYLPSSKRFPYLPFC